MHAKEKLNAPSLKEWKRLYELAAELKKLAPWEWMDESEIFGVQHPDTEETGFVSVMGMLGEHLALGVYLGAEGLYGFWDFQDDERETDPLALFDVPQLQASFEDRQQLERQDRELIKQLGLKFRGAQNYPLFRSIKPGFMPWLITSEEARFLIYAIEQTLEVAPRVKEDALILSSEDDEEDEIYLVRVAEKRNGKLIWRDEMKRIPPPEPERFPVKILPGAINQLKAFPQNKNLIFEIDLFNSPMPVKERNSRPYFPKMLMAAETNSRFILGFELLKPHEDALKAQTELPQKLIELLSSHNMLPGEIRVSSNLLFNLLKSFTQQLNVRLRQTDDLIAIRDAKEGVFGFFGNPFL